jgi:hypothetical protein
MKCVFRVQNPFEPLKIHHVFLYFPSMMQSSLLKLKCQFVLCKGSKRVCHAGFSLKNAYVDG